MEIFTSFLETHPWLPSLAEGIGVTLGVYFIFCYLLARLSENLDRALGWFVFYFLVSLGFGIAASHDLFWYVFGWVASGCVLLFAFCLGIQGAVMMGQAAKKQDETRKKELS